MTTCAGKTNKGPWRDLTDNTATEISGDSRTIRRISTREDLDRLETVWNDLVGQNAYPTVFQTFEWLTAWWEAFGADHSLYVLAIEHGARVIGLAPLMLTESSRFGKRRKVIEFIGAPQADYGDFIGPDNELIAEETLAYLRNNRRDWTEISLSEVSDRSITVNLLKNNLAAESTPFLVRESETCHSFVFEGNDSEREDFSPKRSKRLRRSINWFTRKGPLELEEIRDPEKLKKVLPDFFHNHVVRWKDTFRPSMFLEADHRVFYETLVNKLSPRGRISFFVLRFEGQPIAYEFNFLYRNRSGHYTIAHDRLYHDRSVGRIINHKIRDYYVKGGVEELDFSRGAHEYKNTLSNRSNVNYQVRVFPHRQALRLARWYGSLKSIAPVQRLINNRKFRETRQHFAWLRNTYGLRELMAKGLQKVWRKILDCRTIYVFGFAGCPSVPEARLEVTFARLDESNLDEIASFAGAVAGSEGYQNLARRLGGDADCFAACLHGRIVCIGWGLRRRDVDPETGFSIEPDRKQVILSGGYTSPVARGRGVRPWLMARQLDFYRSQGLAAVVAVDKDNPSSLRVMEKLGFKRLGVFRRIRLFGRLVSGNQTARLPFP